MDRLRPWLGIGGGLAVAAIGAWAGVNELREGLHLGSHHGVMAAGVLMALHGAAEAGERLRAAESRVTERLHHHVRHPALDALLGSLLLVAAGADLVTGAVEIRVHVAGYSTLALLLLGAALVARTHLAFTIAGERLDAPSLQRLQRYRTMNVATGAIVVAASLADILGSGAAGGELAVGVHHAALPLGLWHAARRLPAALPAADDAGHLLHAADSSSPAASRD